MNGQDWESYFAQNRQDRRGIPWCELGSLTVSQRSWLSHVVEVLTRNPGSVDDAGAGEREEDARLLRELAERLNGRATSSRRTSKRRVIGRTRQLAFDLMALKLTGIVLRKVDNVAVAAVSEQLLHDWKFQVRFASERCYDERRGGPIVRFIWSVALQVLVAWHWVRVGKVGFRRELWRGAQTNLRAVVRGEPFARGAMEQSANNGAEEHVPRPRRKKLYWPEALRVAPRLTGPAGRLERQTALLINPFYPKDPHASFGKHVLTPTLALTSLAGAKPSNWQVTYWDENLLQGSPPCDPLPAVVGITVHLTFAARAFELADWYRARGSKVVLGGLHVLSCPEECAPHADALALGEGVQVWPEILRDVEADKLQHEYRGDYRRAYQDEPVARRAVLPRGGFLTTASVIATRGCHNRLRFCYLATEGLQMPYQMRDVEQVVEEIYDTGEPYAVFTDNNWGSRRDYLRRLCRALRPLEIIWSAAVTIDVTDDPRLVREMALAGCTGVFIGFESLTNDNLTGAHKKTPRTEDYARRVRILHDYGIQVNGSFVLGFDQDRRDCFARTVEWIETNRLECATFHLLTPYPGTPLYRQLESEGRLLHKDWSRYDTAHVVFRPRHMTPEELADGYAWCYERLFSHRSIWQRRPADASAVLPYLAMAYLYKRSNRLWHLLIRHRLTHAVWRPVVEVTRRRHVRFRRRFAAQPEPAHEPAPGTVLPAGA